MRVIFGSLSFVEILYSHASLILLLVCNENWAVLEKMVIVPSQTHTLIFLVYPFLSRNN